MKNPIKVTDWPVSRILLVIWIIFSIIFVANAARNYLQREVYQLGAQHGMQNAVAQTMALGQQCQPVVLNLGDQQVTLVNPACGAGGQTPAAPAEVTE
jgi:hypothetical protein